MNLVAGAPFSSFYNTKHMNVHLIVCMRTDTHTLICKYYLHISVCVSVRMHTIKCTFMCFVLELQQIFDSFGYLKLAFDSFRILAFRCDLLFIYMEFILRIIIKNYLNFVASRPVL